MTTAANPYLADNFAPVDDETTAIDLAVTGELPRELNGRFLRIGPNPVGLERPNDYHWFGGSGLAHGVRLREGKAEWYRSRFVHDDRFVALRGLPPVPGPQHGLFDGTVNTNIIGHAGRTWALVEAGSVPVELSYELETITRSNFDGTLPGSFTAHPKRDPQTGELHAVVYYWEWDYVQYVVVGVDGRVRRTVNVPVPGKPMLHDCAITATQVLLFDLPCQFNLERAMAQEWPYVWNPDYAGRVGLLPREGSASDVRWCELDVPLYTFHPLNAWDAADGTVVVYTVVHPKMFANDLRGPNEGGTRLERWVLDPGAGRIRRTVVCDRPMEFPRHHEGLIGQPCRYGYTAEFAPNDQGGITMGGMFRHDLDRDRTETHDVGRGRAAMEPVFVPREGATAEDDGWILAYVHDGQRNAADVVVLAGQDFSAPPVATVHLPARVPFGFHGNWVPDAGH